MSIESDLVTFLLAGLSGPLEVYPIVLPEKRTLPALTYQLAGSRPQYTADGPTSYPVTFDLKCWANTYAEAKALQADVRGLLDGYSGQMGSQYAHNVEIDNEFDIHESDRKLYGVSMQINWFNRSL